MMKPILQAEGVCKSYATVKVLQDVQLRLFPGEVHALVGENGAGKSTLIKALTGIIKPDSGHIVLRGEPLNISHPKEIEEKGIGIVHQEFNLMPELTVAQNIFIGREPGRFLNWLIDEKRLNQMAAETLSQFGSHINPSAKVSSLSVAQQQMVEIAKAVSYRCEILIMDEPTAALTDKEAEALFSVVEQLKDKGVAILFVSHRMSDLQRLADRVTVLRDGRFIAEHLFADIDIDTLVREMVGRELKSIFPSHTQISGGERTLSVQHLCVQGVLNDISFDAYSGEILGISGLMGSGRTELAKAIIGALPITSGKVLIGGVEQTRLSPSRTVQLGIGYVTEDRKQNGPFMSKSIKENIIAPSYALYSPRGFIQESRAVRDCNNLVGKMRVRAIDIGQQMWRLSGGNQQKVVLSKWLCRGSNILILDEPTRGIDVGSKYEIYQIMHELLEQNVTIIMISSDLPEILGMSDRILVMSKGRITAELTREEATQEKIAHYSLG